MERCGKGEAISQLRGQVGVEGSNRRPAAEEVRAFAPELPRARSGEHETEAAALLDQRVDDREKLRCALDFVQDDVVAPAKIGDSLPQPFGSGRKLTLRRRIEQVDTTGLRKRMARPVRLAGSARSEQEVAARGLFEKSRPPRHYVLHYRGMGVKTSKTSRRAGSRWLACEKRSAASGAGDAARCSRPPGRSDRLAAQPGNVWKPAASSGIQAHDLRPGRRG